MLIEHRNQNFNKESSIAISNDLKSVFALRRTVRDLSDKKVPIEVVINAINIARLAPSGANKQPWSFSLISNQEIKNSIREIAENNERIFYHENGNENWKKELSHLHTDDQKEFITSAPYLIAAFYSNVNRSEDGVKTDVNYYAKESVGIATGMLISALHMSGLSVLTYTPSKMQFLPKLLNRPKDEKLFILLGVGLPKDDAKVPQISKKSIDDILTMYK